MTSKIDVNEWQAVSNGTRLDRGSYFISYVPSPAIGYEGEETALVFEQSGDTKYLIEPVPEICTGR